MTYSKNWEVCAVKSVLKPKRFKLMNTMQTMCGTFFACVFCLNKMNILETHSAKIISSSCFCITSPTVLKLFQPIADKAMGRSGSAAMIYPEPNRDEHMEIMKLMKLYV